MDREVNEIIGAGDGSRTHDLMITNHLLWPLSYPGLSDMPKEGFKNRPNLSRVSMFCSSNPGGAGSGPYGAKPGERITRQSLVTRSEIGGTDPRWWDRLSRIDGQDARPTE